MSKIDKEFFEDFYKFDQKQEKMKFNLGKDLFEKKRINSSSASDDDNNNKKLESLSHDLINREEDGLKINISNNKNNNNILNAFIKSDNELNSNSIINQKKEFLQMEIDDENSISNHDSASINKPNKSAAEERFNFNDLENENNITNINNNTVYNYQLIRHEQRNKIKKIQNVYKNRDLVYEFAIYHPLKNSKTQEILIAGSDYLHQLKDKIYCVLDEIQSSESNEASFFFIENCFYNDTRNPYNKILSSKILENKIRKLNCYTSYGNEFTNNSSGNNKHSNLSNSNTNINNNNNNATKTTMNYNSNLISSLDSNNDFAQNSENNYKQHSSAAANNNNFIAYETGLDNNNNFKAANSASANNFNKCFYNNQNEELKFAFYDKDLYSIPFYISNEIYDEVSMNAKKINEINFRIGYPYLFRHIDHCDHMIMLTDIRFLDECDRFDEENNCFLTFQKKLKRRICDSCSFYYAKFISINDKITHDYKVLFYCESCLKKIHASEFKDPSMPNTLKLIPYFHD